MRNTLILLFLAFSLSFKAGAGPLHTAVLAGNIPQIEQLIMDGAWIEDRFIGHVTPLMLAAQEGHLGAVLALLKAKANPEARDSRGTTPLMYAVKGGHVAVINLLRDLRANRPNTDVKAEGGFMPLRATSNVKDEAANKPPMTTIKQNSLHRQQRFRTVDEYKMKEVFPVIYDVPMGIIQEYVSVD